MTLLPALIVTATVVALTPAAAAPAAAAPVVVTRDGATVEHTRTTSPVSWPDTVAGAPAGAARLDVDGDGVDEVIVAVRLDADATYPKGRSAVLVRYRNGDVDQLVKPDVGLGAALAVADFDRDGFGDLAVTDTDGLWVFPGGAGGLRPPSAGHLTGRTNALAAADLNGDGYADLATGNNLQTVNQYTLAGQVTVYFGGSEGLAAAGSLRFTEGVDGVPGTTGQSRYFGSALAVGDVVGDSHPDLVVGAGSSSGGLTVLPGTASGPSAAGATDVDGLDEHLTTLGTAVLGIGGRVAVAEVTGDGRADVVAAGLQSRVTGRLSAGAAVVLPGATAGLAVDRLSIWHNSTPGIPGRPAAEDGYFGSALVAGDLGGDGRAELLIGAKGLSSAPGGTLTVLPNGAGGVTAAGSTQVTDAGAIEFGRDAQLANLAGSGTRTALITSRSRITVYAPSTGTRAVTADFFAAQSLKINSFGSLPTGPPEPVSAAGQPTTPPGTPLRQPRSRFDLDGDGRDDVVAGQSDGMVVRYSGSGRTDDLMVRGGGEGPAFAAGDFNGDGYADLAVGAPGDNTGKPAIRNQGSVRVAYGSPEGLDYDRAQFFDQDTPGVLDSSEPDDYFGAALAAGDLNGDGRADLAIGARYEDTGKGSDAGAVTVLYGSAAGLTATGSAFFSQRDTWIPDTEESGDYFGYTLAIGDVTGDRRADLAVASPGENGDFGSVTLVQGAAAGLSPTGVTTVPYAAIKRSMLTRAEFGLALAVADLNRDGRAEVIAGAPGATAGTVDGAGQVVAFTGSASGITAGSIRIVHQDTVGAPGTAEYRDRFGASLATGDVTGDGYPDLLVGSPQEATGSLFAAGMVNLFPGSAAGVTGTGGSGWDQNSPDVPGTAQAGDGFGSSVAVLDLDGTGGQDAMVGSCCEDPDADNPGHPGGSVTEFIARGTTLAPRGVWTPSTLAPLGRGFGYITYLGTSMVAS